MTYLKAFPDFVLDVEIPAGFNDVSWRQDACPSWENPATDMLLMIDYLNPAEREMEGGRFLLINCGDEAPQTLLQTENYTDLIEFLNKQKEPVAL